ncbi:hypothetical protein C4K27_6061 [Pseudomonas chlororaphis subsp. chlororaphis]|nr:hypothetical protein C4K27_6061 [Pseudomonas chlororaphis subsp. chlororaphis]
MTGSVSRTVYSQSAGGDARFSRIAPGSGAPLLCVSVAMMAKWFLSWRPRD